MRRMTMRRCVLAGRFGEVKWTATIALALLTIVPDKAETRLRASHLVRRADQQNH